MRQSDIGITVTCAGESEYYDIIFPDNQRVRVIKDVPFPDQGVEFEKVLDRRLAVLRKWAAKAGRGRYWDPNTKVRLSEVLNAEVSHREK